MTSTASEQRLRVGDEIPIKPGWMRKQSLIYAGMVDDRIASIVINNADVHNSWSYNLFIPRFTYEFNTRYGQVRVVHFNADELVVQVSRR